MIIQKIFSFIYRLLLLCVLILPLVVYADGFGRGAGNGGAPPKKPKPPPCDDACSCPDGGPSSGSAKPINYFTGSETHSVSDLVVKGVMDIELAREYDSSTSYDSPLGSGWAFTLDQRLYQYPDNSVVIRMGAGQRYTYVKSGGTYVTPPGCVRGQLEEQIDGSFILTYTNGHKDFYDAKGLLTAKQSKQGDRLEFSYSITQKSLTGTSEYSINPDAPMTVAMTYQITKIEERLADGNLSGHYVNLIYDTNTGRLNSATSNDGRTVTYTHDTYTYNGNTSTRGNLTQVLNPANIKSIYKYEDSYDHHNLTWIEEGEGSTPVVNSYGTANQLDRVIQQTYGNDMMEFDYAGGLGIQTKVTHTVKDKNGANPVSYTTIYDFNDVGYTSKITDPFKNEVRYFHTAQGSRLFRTEWWQNTNPNLLTAATLVLYRTEDYRHDPEGNRTYTAIGKTTFAGGVPTELFSPSGAMIVTETANDHGRVIQERTYQKAANGNLVGQIFDTEYTYYYDGNGVPTELKDTQRQISASSWYTETRSYDSRGLLNKITYPDGTEKILDYLNSSLYPTKIYWKISGTASPYKEADFEYDAKGNIKKYWDANSNLTQYDYDDLNRTTKITNALNEETIFTYNSSTGLLETIEVGKSGANAGITIKYIYDNQKQLAQIQRKSVGGSFVTVQSYAYDSAGRRVESTDANNHTTYFAYNALDQLTSVTDADGHSTAFTYDMLGNRLTTTDALNHVTQFTYNDLWQLATVVEKGVTPNATTQLSYDAEDNLLSVTDAEGKITQYTYDGLSNKLSETRPLGQMIQYSYDSRNRLKDIIYPRNQKKSYDYFAWNGLNHIKTYNSSNTLLRTQTYGYDYAGNTTSVTDDAVQSGELFAITYDALNRPDVRTIKYLPGGNRTLDNDYNRFGARSALTYDETGTSNDYTHSYTYNVEGRLTAASLKGQSYGFSYYDNDQLNTLTYPNAVTQAYTYLNSGPIDTVTITGNTVLEALDYGYNAVNNINSLVSNIGTTNYGYDGQDHLATATFPGGSGLNNESYAYDKAGNREDSSNANLWQYNNNHQLTQDPNYTYGYDNDGNMSSRTKLASPQDASSTSASFTHDENNRLIAYSNSTDGISASYLYGPSNQRLKKTVNGTSTWFLYDGAQLIAEYNSSGTVTKRYDYLPGQYAPVQMTDANGTYQVHSDHLSAPILLTNSSKAVVWSAKKQAFGKTTVNEDPDNNTVNVTMNMRFAGQYYDSESKLHYNWNRYMDSATGKYLERDPIGLRAGVNAYGYTFQDPLNWTDVMGLKVSTPGGGNITKDPATGKYKANKCGDKFLDDLVNQMNKLAEENPKYKEWFDAMIESKYDNVYKPMSDYKKDFPFANDPSKQSRTYANDDEAGSNGAGTGTTIYLNDMGDAGHEAGHASAFNNGSHSTGPVGSPQAAQTHNDILKLEINSGYRSGAVH